MRNRPIRFALAVLTVAVLTAPAASRAGALATGCFDTTTTVNDYMLCEMPLAGNMWIQVEYYAVSSTPIRGVVYAVLVLGNSTTPYQIPITQCTGDGMFSATVPLRCRADVAVADFLPTFAEHPAGVPITCVGFSGSNIKSGTMTCASYSI